MSLKDPKIQITVFLTLVVLVGFYFWYNSLYQPMLAEKEERSEELQKLKANLERVKLQAARRVSLQQEYEAIHEQWRVVETLLPKERDMSDFIRQLHRIKGKVDATIERLSPLPAVSMDFYQENPYEVEMLITYHGLGEFFSHVANLPIIVDVSDLELMALVRGEEEEGEREIVGPTLRSRFTLTTYSLLENVDFEEEVSP
jgi:Tfp pilus assembly protein PilO